MYLFYPQGYAVQSRHSIDFGFDVQSSNDSERVEGIKDVADPPPNARRSDSAGEPFPPGNLEPWI
jgi:hypothetical protein